MGKRRKKITGKQSHDQDLQSKGQKKLTAAQRLLSLKKKRLGQTKPHNQGDKAKQDFRSFRRGDR